MKTNLTPMFAGIFFALILSTGMVLAGNDFYGKSRNRSISGNCANRLSGLTPDQKNQVTALATNHQAMMNDFREKRRSTSDQAQKDQIKQLMDSEVTSHRNAVRTLLNTDQQKQFDQLPRNYGSQGARYGNCNQSPRPGKCNAQGKASGRRCR